MIEEIINEDFQKVEIRIAQIKQLVEEQKATSTETEKRLLNALLEDLEHKERDLEETMKKYLKWFYDKL